MPFYSPEKVYRSLVYYFSQLTPSGVVVVDGASYGIRLEDPTGKSPAIAINIEEHRDFPIELGSDGTQYDVVITISALSRFQRDALKAIVHSGLASREIPIYGSFTDFTPASGAVVENYLEVGNYFKFRDMPNFDTDRERFFWTAVCFVSLETLGI